MTTSKPIILTDLDDTLFQTARKMNGTPVARVATLDRQGQPLSMMCEKQASYFDLLSETCEVIPVTARGSDEISRVLLPFSSYKVITHGAVILDGNNAEVPGWEAHMRALLGRIKDRLLALEAAVNAILGDPEPHGMPGLNGFCRINEEYGEPVYLVAKVRDKSQVAWLATLNEAVQAQGPWPEFYVHRNDNNVAWIPVGMGKSNAVEYLLSQMGNRESRMVIGMGDSLTDLPFMQHCDMICTPTRGQLNRAITSALEVKHG